MLKKFKITKEDYRKIYTQTIRFLSHILLLDLIAYLVESNYIFLNTNIIKSLFYTIIAVFLYHAIIKKLVY